MRVTPLGRFAALPAETPTFLRSFLRCAASLGPKPNPRGPDVSSGATRQEAFLDKKQHSMVRESAHADPTPGVPEDDCCYLATIAPAIVGGTLRLGPNPTGARADDLLRARAEGERGSISRRRVRQPCNVQAPCTVTADQVKRMRAVLPIWYLRSMLAGLALPVSADPPPDSGAEVSVFALPTRIDRIGRVLAPVKINDQGPFKFIGRHRRQSLDNFAPSCCGARARSCAGSPHAREWNHRNGRRALSCGS